MAEEDKTIIYSMVHVTKRHGQKKVLDDISLSYFYGAKIGVLGLNGAGKSSLLRILAGEDRDFEGETILSEGYTLGYLRQEPLLEETRTVREVVEEGAGEVMALLREYDEINAAFAEPMDDEAMEKLLARQGEVQEKLDASGAWDIDSRLDMAMEALNCPPGDSPVGQLSGGERRRVALCRLLLQEPDILLLDEPTNHLDAETVGWLEQHLQRYPGTVIAVTHDRYFLDDVAQWILELDRGAGIPWRGNYSSWLKQKEERLSRERKQADERSKTLRRELEWIGSSAKGQRTKSKARLRQYESLLNEDGPDQVEDLQIYIPPGPRLGDVAVEMDGVTKGFEGRTLIQDASFQLPPGAVVGIIGPNGAGKTTLFRMITGEEAPDAGTVRLGDTVKLAYAEQTRAVLEDEKTVWEMISGGQEILKLGRREINSRAWVSRFNFSGADQQKKVGVLSGGERNRVQLALMLRSGANLLLFDEPTNDLDVNTLRALEDGILHFAGSSFVISHDRWFLDRVATHILAFEGEGSLFLYEGNFSEYENNRRERLGEGPLDRKVPYKHLTRD